MFKNRAKAVDTFLILHFSKTREIIWQRQQERNINLKKSLIKKLFIDITVFGISGFCKSVNYIFKHAFFAPRSE